MCCADFQVGALAWLWVTRSSARATRPPMVCVPWEIVRTAIQAALYILLVACCRLLLLLLCTRNFDFELNTLVTKCYRYKLVGRRTVLIAVPLITIVTKHICVNEYCLMYWYYTSAGAVLFDETEPAHLCSFVLQVCISRVRKGCVLCRAHQRCVVLINDVSCSSTFPRLEVSSSCFFHTKYLSLSYVMQHHNHHHH